MVHSQSACPFHKTSRPVNDLYGRVKLDALCRYHFFFPLHWLDNVRGVVISKFTVDRTANLSSLAPNSSNYREAIRAFPNHTAGFPTRLIAL